MKNPAVKGWDDLSAQHPEAAARAHDFLRADPMLRTDRNHPLRGQLGQGIARSRQLQRWQHEVTSGGRIWFLPDPDRRIVWFEVVSLSHPKLTE